MEGEIATAIAAHIELVLSPRTLERISSARSVKPEAQIAYLSGLQASNQRTREGFNRAIAEFQRAIALDPDYALAYAGLARSYVIAPIAGGLSSKEAMPKSREAASHALMLDPNLSDAHDVMGMVAAHYDYDWKAAQQEFQRAIELNPSNPYAHFFYSNSYLSPNGRHDEAIAEIRQAIELDPLSVIFRSFLGRTYIWARRYDDAITQFRQAQELNPNLALNHERLSHLYAYLKRYHEAIEEDAQARLLSGEDADSVSGKKRELQKALAQYGPRGFWETLLKFAQAPQNPTEAYVDSYGFAIVYAQLGDKDKALQSLEQAYAERDFMLTEIGVEPALDPLRSDPAFKTILARVGLGQ